MASSVHSVCHYGEIQDDKSSLNERDYRNPVETFERGKITPFILFSPLDSVYILLLANEIIEQLSRGTEVDRYCMTGNTTHLKSICC